MVDQALFTSNKDDWETPRFLFDILNSEFSFTLDPCCSDITAKCAKYYTKQQDGLVQTWEGAVFCNPPYGREIGAWIEKCWLSAEEGCTVVALIPSRTDTIWWHIWCMKSAEIRFLRTRLSFGQHQVHSGVAPFPSVVVVFRKGENVHIVKEQPISPKIPGIFF